MKMQTGAWLAGLCLLGAAGGAAAQQETYRCHQAEGQIAFQSTPCPVTELAPQDAPAADATPAPAPEPAPALLVRPTVPPRAGTVPATAAVAPAAPRPRAARALTPEEEAFVRPTRRKREVLALSAQFERCRADVPGFAERSALIYAAWTRRHADVLNAYQRQLAAKVRASRRGESTLPLQACTDDWLRSIEPLSRMPDARFATVEKTWQVFMGALMTGDRETAMACLSGSASLRWKTRVENLTNEELRTIASSIRALKVQWGDDYAKEGVIADTEDRVVGIAFQNVNEEWKITDWGGAAAPVVP